MSTAILLLRRQPFVNRANVALLGCLITVLWRIAEIKNEGCSVIVVSNKKETFESTLFRIREASVCLKLNWNDYNCLGCCPSMAFWF